MGFGAYTIGYRPRLFLACTRSPPLLSSGGYTVATLHVAGALLEYLTSTELAFT
jgi:hypothetical protein